MAERYQITLQIEGMTCDGCVGHVRKALAGVDGVYEVRLPTWQAGKAVVLASDTVADDALIGAVERAGYRTLVREKRPVSGERKIPEREGVDYDLMIIGGGSAAFAAAIKGAELGAKVAIVEEGTIGGTCVNIGCVPSKTLIRAAEHCYHAAYSQFEGLTACPPPRDWQRVIAQKDALVAALRQGKYVDVAAAYPTISILTGHAELAGGRSVAIEGKSYAPGKIIIATGSRPLAPPIPGLTEAGFLDSTDALSLPELPESLIVIGAGAIGLELAQLFGRFGVKVTVLEAGPRIAPLEEPEIGDALCGYLAEEKIDALCNARIERVSRAGNGYVVEVSADGKKHTFEAAKLLVATGRRPHTTGFGLDRAGVQLGERGEIVVDPHLRTTNPDIFAAGDCIGNPMYVYVAAYAGGLAAENALTEAGRVYDLLPLPRVTFTDPQIASVGLTEAQAKANGRTVKTATLPLTEVPHAIAARNTKGLIKLVAEQESGKLLGAHILAAEAGEVIQEATLAIRFGLRVQDLVETFHPYLTMAEGLKLAALTFQKDVKHLSCCAA